MKKSSILFLAPLFILLVLVSCDPSATGTNGNGENDTTGTKVEPTEPIGHKVPANFKFNPVPQAELFDVFARNLEERQFKLAEQFSTEDGPLSESGATYTSRDESQIYISISDFGFSPELYKEFLSGVHFPSGTEGMLFSPELIENKELSAFSGVNLSSVSDMRPALFVQATVENYRELKLTDNLLSITPNELDFGSASDFFQATPDLAGSLNVLKTEIPNLAGWNIYDQENNISMLYMGYNDRYIIVLSEAPSKSSDNLMKVMESINYEMLDKLSASGQE